MDILGQNKKWPICDFCFEKFREKNKAFNRERVKMSWLKRRLFSFSTKSLILRYKEVHSV